MLKYLKFFYSSFKSHFSSLYYFSQVNRDPFDLVHNADLKDQLWGVLYLELTGDDAVVDWMTVSEELSQLHHGDFPNYGVEDAVVSAVADLNG